MSVAVLVFALVLPRVASAAGMNDPTRPPLPTPRPAAAPVEAAPELVLQSVRISSAGSFAVINGRLLALGARIGDARIIQIAEDEVVVEIDGNWQTLKLYPGVRKGASHAVSPRIIRRVDQPAPAAGRLTPVVLRNRISK